MDFPRAAYGFKSDEATYYMMGLSLADDGDLTYGERILVRVWREFPGGPAGVFLKKGETIQGAPDPNPNRYFLRQVVHLSAVCRAVHPAVRHQRLSRAERR